MSLSHRFTFLTAGVLVAIAMTPSTVTAQDAPKLKLWINGTAIDTFSCNGMLIQLADYHRDDNWLGHVFDLKVTNLSDAPTRFDPTMFTALLQNGTQRTFPGAEELAELAVNGYRAKQELKNSQAQDRKRLEIKSRRDLMAENILPTASSLKRIALGPSPSGGIAIGGRAAEELKEYKAADIPLTLYCGDTKVGMVSKPGK